MMNHGESPDLIPGQCRVDEHRLRSHDCLAHIDALAARPEHCFRRFTVPR